MTKIFSALDSTELTKLHAKAKCVCTLEISQNSGFMRLFITIWIFSTLLANVSMYFQGKIFGFLFGNGDFSCSSNFCIASDRKKSQNVPEQNGHPFLNMFQMDYDQTQTSCV